MKIYKIIDCRKTYYEGNWQIVKISDEYPRVVTVGVYTRKKDAKEDLKKLNESITGEIKHEIFK